MATAIYPGEYTDRPLHTFINDPSLDTFAKQAEYLLSRYPSLLVPRVQYKRPGVKNTCWYIALKEKPDIFIANFTITSSNLNIELRLPRFFSIKDEYVQHFGMGYQNNLPTFRLKLIGIKKAVEILGVYIDAAKPYILDGTYKTPGRSSAEYFIKNDLMKLYPNENIRHGERPIAYPNGSFLELDLQIPSLNIAIEIQGPTHYPESDIYRNHSDVAQRDDFKKKWCKKNNIKLIHIKWHDYMKTIYRSSEKVRCQQLGLLLDKFIKSNEPFIEFKEDDWLSK